MYNKLIARISRRLLAFLMLSPLGVAGAYATEISLEGKVEVESEWHATGEGTLDPVKVTGQVTDEKGAPMPGVTVLIKGTTNATATDVDGSFTLSVEDKDAVLVVSMIGYEAQEVRIGANAVRNQAVMNISLRPDQKALEEVVVVGFGTQKKVSVTGSISTVSTKELLMTANPSLSNAIGGRLPGIVTRQTSGEPGFDAAQVFIRGLGTWTGARGPLVLVDGVERDLNSINTQEIESFSMLKDASATAVYGVRGANGVILITTKRGVKGKPKVIFRTESAMLTAMRLPDYINGPEYANLINESLINEGKAPRFTEAEIEKFRTGSDPYLYPNVDWVDEVLKKNTFQTINNLSVTGGGDIARYYVNVGYTVQNGIYKEDEDYSYRTNAQSKRYNFRSNIDLTLSKSLTMELGVGGIIRHNNFPGTSAAGIFNALRIISPIQYPVYNPDGSLGGGAAWLGENPYGQATQSGYTLHDQNTIQGTFGSRWDLSKLVTPGLSVQGRFAYDHFYANTTERRKNYELRQYTGKDAQGNDLYNTIREESPLGYINSSGANRAVYTEAAINYERNFGKHAVTALALFNRREGIDLTAPNSTANLPFRREGLAGRLTYGFDERYLLEFNAGYNGSENFPKGKRYGFFPSISAGWIVSGEKFWNVDFVNHLKFRASHGQVGNDQIGPRFIFNTTVNRQGQSYLFGENMAFFQGYDEALIGNPNVTWEVSTKTNVGMDLEFFNGKITLQVDAFKEKRENILIQRGDVPRVSGIYPWIIPFANLGKVDNKGIDGQLIVRNSTQSGFYYSFNSNFTFARNKIIKNDEPTPLYPYMAREGQRIDQPFGLISLGLFRDLEDIANSPKQTFMEIVRPGDIKYKDVNGDGIIDTYDQVAIGDPRTPEIMYGFGGTVGYKAFEISAFFTGVANTSLFIDGPSMYAFQLGMGSYNVLREYYDNRWTPENPNARYPGVITSENRNNYRTSTHYLQDASYLRFKNAEIAYNVPKVLLDRFRIDQTRIFVNGTNLYTWDKIKVIDPESNYGTGGYPLQRALNFGVQVTF
ncbi:SusC/RagA family TonB-linked outer membrane protein [Rufibacter roseus]|uniref:SusC/RagA family TonB-linked outer membrane protein n=1 Tax=Rufibacter roseus TaxID=1567108 RepID=A0ABW2DLL0_9BACT|nr:TonB-dependent receptor [Rufibacter roseus]